MNLNRGPRQRESDLGVVALNENLSPSLASRGTQALDVGGEVLAYVVGAALAEDDVHGIL